MMSSRTRTASRRLIGVVLLALLWGQWTILAHSIAHARPASVVQGSAGPEPEPTWGHQAGSSACVLVDHLLTGQAPGGEPAAAPRLPPANSPISAAATSPDPSPALQGYQARGPPRA